MCKTNSHRSARLSFGNNDPEPKCSVDLNAGLDAEDWKGWSHD